MAVDVENVEENRKKMDKYIDEIAHEKVSEVLDQTHSNLQGLDEDAVKKNRDEFGSNKISEGKKKSTLENIIDAFINPFTAILLTLATISFLTDIVFPYFSLFGNTPADMDVTTVLIILVMVILSGALRYIQESRSNNATERLIEMITTTCTVTRKDQDHIEIPVDDLVVGDIIHFSVGDMIPADVRILDTNDFFVSQSSLTGESDGVEKHPEALSPDDHDITGFDNMAYMGSNVQSGSATGVVVAAGDNTIFGAMSATMQDEPVETSFSRGVNAVSWVLIRFMLFMVPVVFVINGLTKGDWLDAFLYGISIAVGLTPEMLPMIVTTCLAKGATTMSQKKTIVKNLNSIQNFGAFDILCTDKTGTITQDKVVLEYHLDVDGKEDHTVLRKAYLNSFFQTGYKNLMDEAIITKNEEMETANPALVDYSEHYHKIDELPFDFSRRRLTTVVENDNKEVLMVTKGAAEEMLSICSHYWSNEEQAMVPIDDEFKQKALRIVDALNDKGFRVLVLSEKSNPSISGDVSVEDETDMVLLGYLAFLDPPKESTEKAIVALKDHGVATKVLTGDNDKVTRTVCQQVGLEVNNILLGSEIEDMTDYELVQAAEDTEVFAKLSPNQKSRIVTVLREDGHTIGFMGDGVNDANAMKHSDVGISVDTAVDVSKEVADIILLEKDLMVLEQGIVEGRKTYANMIKYIKMTASSNFGNMFSVLAASALLPFLPMLSIHLILLNLIYDCSCLAIPWDNVDEEFIAEPQDWDASSVSSFMIWIGPTSSVFDWTTYLFMYFVCCPMFVSHGVMYGDLATVYSGSELIRIQAEYAAMFQSGWFVESMWSQTLVIHMIRTPKLPFIQSHASLQVCGLTFTGILVLTIIPFTFVGRAIGLMSLPTTFFIYLAVCILGYMLLATSIKSAYTRHFGKLL